MNSKMSDVTNKVSALEKKDGELVSKMVLKIFFVICH